MLLGATRLGMNGELTADGDVLTVQKMTVAAAPVNGELSASVRGLTAAQKVITTNGELTVNVDLLGKAMMPEWEAGKVQPGRARFAVALDGDATRIDRLQWNSSQINASVSGTLVRKEGGPATGPLEPLGRR